PRRRGNASAPWLCLARAGPSGPRPAEPRRVGGPRPAQLASSLQHLTRTPRIKSVPAMRRVAAVPVPDANRFPRLSAYRGGTPRPDVTEASGAAAFVPFAGVDEVDDDRGRSQERAEMKQMLSVLEQFVKGSAAAARPGARVLATVLFTDIVDSTER